MPPRSLPLCASLVSLVGLAAAGACGDDAPVDDPVDARPACTTPAAERLLPLAVGTSWTYDTSDMGGPVEAKVTTVEALEDVGDRKAGITAYRIRTEKAAGHVVSWQEDRCSSIARHREQSYDGAGVLLSDQFYVPSKLRVDEAAEHVAMGATWTTEYTEVEEDPVNGTSTVSKSETWTVEATAEEVTVPAGTFTALKLRKTTSGNADKLYWFVAGVGKVKEEGENIELLTAYTLADAP